MIPKRCREFVRRRVFGLLRRMLNHQDGVDTLHEALTSTLASKVDFMDLKWAPTPYEELAPVTPRPASSPIFVTGRFRSGSTLVWNIFRQLKSCCSFYEPFNERKWFLIQDGNGYVDHTHLNVDEYWREYEGMAFLEKHYREAWISRDLFMSANAFDVQMYDFIQGIAGLTTNRAVLQFNRVDFRLPWLRRKFPDSKILHVYRNPRDQWCSTLAHSVPFGRDAGTLAEFQASDGFYLTAWIVDLQHSFPFLADCWEQHPYVAHYYLWRLSYLFGTTYSHASVGMEQLVSQPRSVLEPIMDEFGLTDVPWDDISRIIVPPRLGRWRDYASASWFGEIEARCERQIQQHLDFRSVVSTP